MPVYEYHCTSCGKDFEYEHRMSDPRRTVCEACGGELERLISRTSFAFKGGGWYKDLYASSKPESGSKPSEAKPSSSDSSSSSESSSSGASTSTSTGTGTGTGTGSGSSTAAAS
jgi:putative FmdB family regulatory protein